MSSIVGTVEDVGFTRRGRVVAAVVGVAFLSAWVGGARSLTAVVVPFLVAFAAGVVQLHGLESPRAVRRLPPDDFVGATRTLSIRFAEPSAPGRDLEDPFVAVVRERTGDGLAVREQPGRIAVGDGEAEIEVDYERRGRVTIGPTDLLAIDVFGLLERPLTCESIDRVLVYPERHPVAGRFREGFAGTTGRSDERDEFDQLRDYVPGDEIRDIHWRTTAKRDELTVKTYADAESEKVTVSAGGPDPDGAASAATSVALALLEDGIPVEISAPNGRVDALPTTADGRRLLELLALMDAGEVPDPEADVVIESTDGRTTVRHDGGTLPFDEVRDVDGRAGAAGPGGVPA